jgi:hypothetical protein
MWVKIDGYENYSINEFGEVKNNKTEYILKKQIDRYGYYYVSIKSSKKFKLHRLLAKYFKPDEYKEDLQVDHIDRNPLNNSLENLRMVTSQQNNCNRTKKQNCSSKYKGVSFDKRANNWRVCIKINGKSFYIGRYNSELDAAISYNKFLDEHNLIFYPKNII